MDALGGLAATVCQCRKAVALGIGHRGLYRVANKGICVSGVGAVGEDHLQWAVELVILCPCRGDVVERSAEAVYTLAVNSRVVNPDHATERVLLNPAARHHNLLGMRHRNEQQLKQQQQDDILYVECLFNHNK